MKLYEIYIFNKNIMYCDFYFLSNLQKHESWIPNFSRLPWWRHLPENYPLSKTQSEIHPRKTIHNSPHINLNKFKFIDFNPIQISQN